MNSDLAGGNRVAIIGTGRVGTAMSKILSDRGFKVVSVYDLSREAAEAASGLCGARIAGDCEEAVRNADIVLITTPDRFIEETCRSVCASVAESGSDLEGKVFVHMSGALSLRSLDSAVRSGAGAASIHPLQTFADVEGALRFIPGSTFGVTCQPELSDWAEDFVSALEGTPLEVREEDRVLYHAAAVMACNFLVMVEHAASEVYRGQGFDLDESMRAALPLIRATVENIARLGPESALTGPLSRGDLATIEVHLRALEDIDPGLARLYREVSLWGIELVRRRGELGPATIEAMEDLLIGEEEGKNGGSERG